MKAPHYPYHSSVSLKSFSQKEKESDHKLSFFTEFFSLVTTISWLLGDLSEALFVKCSVQGLVQKKKRVISNVCFGHFLKLEAAAIDKGARAAAHKHQRHLGGSCVGGWGRRGNGGHPPHGKVPVSQVASRYCFRNTDFVLLFLNCVST